MKKFKKFNSNENFPEEIKLFSGDKNPIVSKSINCVYIGNLESTNCKNDELNKLINIFVDSSPDTKNTKIKSIKVYKDCIYIYFDNKNDALNAVKFFDNYTFKNSKFESFLINSVVETNLDQSQNTNCEYECKNIFWNESIECEILVSNRLLKKYADTINERLQKTFFGLNTFIKYSSNDANLEQPLTKEIIKDAFNRNLLYLITINQSNEKYNSLNLIIFNKWRFLKNEKNTFLIKENKNIPSNKAFDILKSDYRDYLDNIKDFFLKSKNDSFGKKSDPSISESDTDINACNDKKLFKLVINKMKDLTTIGNEDVDFLISYLNNQKKKLLSSSKTNSRIQDTKNENTYSNIQSNVPQVVHTVNQNVHPMLHPQPISNMFPQPVFYPNPHLQQPLNFAPPQTNSNNTLNQIPALMSLHQPQVPALMTLRPYFRSPGQNSNLYNQKRH